MAVILGVAIVLASAVAAIAAPAAVDLGTLGGTSAYATAVNGSGLVVGDSQIAGDAGYHSFVWTPAGGMVDLGTLGGTHSFAYAGGVSSTGQVVGFSRLAGDTSDQRREPHQQLGNAEDERH